MHTEMEIATKEENSGRREEEREGERKREKGAEGWMGKWWRGRYRLKYIRLIY